MTDVLEPGKEIVYPPPGVQAAPWSEPLGNESAQGKATSIGAVTTPLVDIPVDPAADPQVISGMAEIVGIKATGDYYHAIVPFEALSNAGLTPASPPTAKWYKGVGADFSAPNVVVFALTAPNAKTLRLNVVTNAAVTEVHHQAFVSINQKTRA